MSGTLTDQEEQANAQSSATGGYYQGYYQQQQQPQPSAGNAPQQPSPGDVQGWRSWMQQYVPDDLKSNPEFLNIVLAGAHGESGLDANRVQPDGNGRGLFQFDTSPGAMGYGLSDDQLFDPSFQAQRIVPMYAQAYRNAPQNLSGADKAAWVAARAEHPYQWQDPLSTANQNYRRGFYAVTGPQAFTVPKQ